MKNPNKQPNYRRCISCRCLAPKESFYRVVRVYPDYRIQLNEGMGRSAYICRNSECLAIAKKKNKLGRALKTNIPEEIYQQLYLNLR